MGLIKYLGSLIKNDTGNSSKSFVLVMSSILSFFVGVIAMYLVILRYPLTSTNENGEPVISKNVTIKIPEHFIPSFKPSKSFVSEVKSNVKK